LVRCHVDVESLDAKGLASWLKGKGFAKATQDWVVRENVTGSTFSMWSFDLLHNAIPQGDAMKWHSLTTDRKPGVRKAAGGPRSRSQPLEFFFFFFSLADQLSISPAVETDAFKMSATQHKNLIFLWDRHLPQELYPQISGVPQAVLTTTYTAMMEEVGKWGAEASTFNLSYYFAGRKKNHDGKKQRYAQPSDCNSNGSFHSFFI